MHFLGFLAKQSKSYTTMDEFVHRKQEWAKTDKWIKAFQETNSTFTVDHNKYSDWTDAEK